MSEDGDLDEDVEMGDEENSTESAFLETLLDLTEE